MLKIMRMPPLFAKFTKVTCCAGKSQVNLDGFFFFFEVKHLLLCSELKVDAHCCDLMLGVSL
jgi:hypothetical protein